LSACVASASEELSAVSFAVTTQHFNAGDSIVIDQVLSNSPKIGIGDKVVVRGHYHLASATAAKLGLFVTHLTSAPKEKDRSLPSQMALIEGENGSFELSDKLTYEGDLHVSFYPASGGGSFGGVYFVPTAR
jgi:hypothetical protein